MSVLTNARLAAEGALDPVWGNASALFSLSRTHRYALVRQWDRDLPMTCFVMLNPSTADAFQVDNTVRRCLGFAKDWGSGGLLVLNAFGLRSTNPAALYGHLDPVGEDNDAVILAALDQYQPSQVVAGWGQHAVRVGKPSKVRPVSGWRSRAESMSLLLGERLLALAVNKDGTPKHPLYVAGDTVPQPYSP